MLIILLWLKKLKPILKLLNLESMVKSELRSIKINIRLHWKLVKRNIVDFVLKTNSWTYKIKDLTGEKIIGTFYEKELLLSKS